MNKRYNEFKKSDYLRILKATADFCLHYFGYKRKPYIFETRLPKGHMMTFTGNAKHYAIFYDYEQFRYTFNKYDYDVKQSYTMLIAAHEMRHYYQIRQIYAEKPRETQETIKEWRDNDKNSKICGKNNCTILEFYMQPMELDAELFAFVFVANVLGNIVSMDYIDDNFIDILEKEYIKRFGETNTEIFLH